MANYGVKVSQSGYDVKTCADKNLIYSSKFANAFKIAKEGATTLVVASSALGTKTIAHGLGYTPSHLVFVDKVVILGGANKWGVGGTMMDLDAAKDSGTFESYKIYLYSYANATNVYIKIYNNYATQKTFNIYYFIFIEDNS